MKFIPSVGGEYSGSVGGLTASRNRYGQYFRRRAVPVDPASLLQQQRRAAFALAVTRWAEVLDDAARQTWNDYAANTPVLDSLGQSINLTGQAMYIRSQTMVDLAGGTDLELAPTTFDLGTFTPFVIGVISEAALTLVQAFTNTDDWASTVGGFALLFVGRQQNPGRNFFKGPYAFVGKITGSGTPPTSPSTFNLSGNYTEDNVAFYYYRILQADGRLSNVQRLGPLIIVA